MSRETLSPSLLGAVAVLTAAFWFIGRAADGIPGNDGMMLQLGAGLLFYAGAVFLVTMTPVYLLRRETERRLRQRFGPAALDVGGKGVLDPPLSDRAEVRLLATVRDGQLLAAGFVWCALKLSEYLGFIPAAFRLFADIFSWASLVLAFGIVIRGALRGEEKSYRAQRGLPPIPKR